MKVKVIRNTRVDGASVGPDEKGNPVVIDLPKADAQALITAGKAEATTDKKPGKTSGGDGP